MFLRRYKIKHILISSLLSFVIGLPTGFIICQLRYMNENFKSAVENVLLHEGGYVNNPADPGGETNFGISKRSYPRLDIKNLSRDEAIKIYYNDYWLINRLNEIHSSEIATKLLNIFVNIGKKNSEKVICRALRACGIKFDENTIKASELIKAINALTYQKRTLELLPALRSEVAGYYRVLSREKPALKTFLNGWLNRAYS